MWKRGAWAAVASAVLAAVAGIAVLDSRLWRGEQERSESMRQENTTVGKDNMMITNCCERTVGQMVAEKPARARVFESLGIDYCCGGRKSLIEAATEKGMPVQVLLAALESAEQPAEVQETNWLDATLTELADHIEATHHAYLRQELPRLQGLLVKIANVHGGNHPELAEVRDTFLEMDAELRSHMMKEEQILFPMCRQMDSAEGPTESH